MKKSILIVYLLSAFVASAQTVKQGTLSNVTKLTTGFIKYENPQWSKDGQKIAFTEWGWNNLYVMDNNGLNLKQISKDSGVGYGYQWSVDSKEILVRDTRWSDDGRLHAIWSVKMTGEKLKLSEDAVYLQPAAWRYSSRGKKSIILPDGKISANVSKLETVSNSRLKSAKTINKAINKSFLVEDENFYLVDESGNKKLINDKVTLCASFSPDGNKIAFVEADFVCIMNIDGSNKKQLTRGFNPSWVNNSQLVYELTTDNGHEYTGGDLYIVNINNGATKQMTHSANMIEMYPTVSPDGNQLLFVDFNDGQIYSATLK